MRKVLVTSLLVLLSFPMLGQEPSGDSLPAPFGIRMNAKKDQLGKIKKEYARYLFELATVPKPHRIFESYIAQATPKSGVCYVKAISVDIQTSAYGGELRSRFDEIKELVASVHGTPRVVDYLKSGSIWNEPRDWTMALRQKERALMANWSAEDGLIMKYGLKQIIVAAAALDTNTGYVVVEYYFDNYDACEAEAKASESDVF
jgi:hypothetical protein